MQTITTAAKLAFNTSLVKRKYKVFIDWISKGDVASTITAGEFNSTYFAKENVVNDESYAIYKPFILSDSMRLGDNVRLISNKYENGWLGANRSDSIGSFDLADSYTKLLLHCNGADGSQTFIDSGTGKTVTAVGTAQIDTAQSKFGGASLLLDGNSDSLTIPNSADWEIVTVNFTIDMWVKKNLDNVSQYLMEYGAGNSASDTVFQLKIKNTNKVAFDILLAAGSKNVTSTATITGTDWHHIAVVRSVNTITLYLDGVADGTVNVTGISPASINQILAIGKDTYGGGASFFNGWIDNIRISKGIARWTANFTPPTREYFPEVIPDIFTTTIQTKYLTISGSQYNYPVNMDLYYRNSTNTAWVLCQSYTNLTSYITVYTFPTVTTIKGWKLEITKINLADMFACIVEVTTGFREDVSGDLIKDPMDINKELEYDKGSINIGNISANTLTLRLNNTTQKYNPGNVDSYLYPFLRYNKVIQPFIGVDLGDSIEWFAQGKYYIREIKPNPDMTVEIYAVDRMFFLNGEDFDSSIVYENYTKSELQQMLVEDFGLGATEYDIEATTDEIPYAYFTPMKYAEAIKRLEISDGGVAFFDELGIFNSKTRGWTETPISAYYDDSTIIKGSASSPVMASSMKNYIRIKSNPLDSAAQEIVYNSSQSIVIPAGGSKDVACYFNKKPCIDIVDATFTQSNLVIPTLVVVDSYSESNWNTYQSLFAGNYTSIAQSFTGDGNVINSCKFYLNKYGFPTGNIVAKIYTHSGTFGTSSVPTGAALATSDNFDVSLLTTSFGLASFTFSGANKITLTNGTHYVVSVEYSGGNSSNSVSAGYDSSSPTHAGNYSQYSTSWLAINNCDLCLYVFSDVGIIAPDSITITAQSKYSFVTYLTFANSAGADENVLTIEIQAKPLEATGANEVVSQDVDLISVYGKSEYLIDSEFIQDINYAQTLADDLKADYKDPKALEIEIEAITRPYLQLGDTVGVISKKLNIGNTP